MRIAALILQAAFAPHPRAALPERAQYGLSAKPLEVGGIQRKTKFHE
jgi:hypothetical protein